MVLENKKRLLAIPLVLALFALSASCTARDLAVPACLDNDARPAPLVVTGYDGSWPLHEGMLIPNDTPIDARGGNLFHGTTVAFKLNNGVGSRDNICVVGGTITSDVDVNAIWDTWHHNYGFRVQAPNAQIIGAEIRSVGDGIDFKGDYASDWKVIGVRADGGGQYAHAFVHDDCIQNDQMHSGQIVDSKFDGCAAFLSSNSGYDGTGNVVDISRTLVHLEPMLNSHNPTKWGYNQHGGFFKFANPLNYGTPPNLVLRESMFRSDEQAPFGGNSGGELGLPPGTICNNVVVVGWDAWTNDDRASWVDRCGGVDVADVDNPKHQGPTDAIPDLRVGTVADWDAAVAAWDTAHPPLVP
jgi:hypothetical protein